MEWVALVQERARPLAGDAPLSPAGVATSVLVALALVSLQPLWRPARLAVTLVHELGHALVGMAMGRRFTGLVVRGDMSGHTITAGSSRGPGRVLTAWAGYPAPAVVGAAAVWMAVRGWAAPVLSVALLVLLMAVLRIRSPFTAVVVAVALAGLAGLWWWRDDELQRQVLVAVGLLLVVGAWRHIGAVARYGSRADDPGALARLTGVPRVLWTGSFALVATAASWVVVTQLLGALGR